MAGMYPNNLKRMRELVRPKMTQGKLAELSGHTQPQISMWENGSRELKDLNDIKRLAAALDCEAGDIVANSGSPDRKFIPVVGIVGAGSEIYPIDDHAKGAGMYDVECPHVDSLNPEKAIALEVRGVSMYPLMAEGDLIFYQNEPIPGVPQEYYGKICVVKIASGPTLVKRVQKGSGVGRFDLESLNPETPTIKNAQVEWSIKVNVMLPR